jgi:hypothetical protein
VVVCRWATVVVSAGGSVDAMVVAVGGGAVVAAAVVVVVVVAAVTVALTVAAVTVVLGVDMGGSGAGAGVPDDGPRQTTSKVRRSRASRPMMVRATIRPDRGRGIPRTVAGRGAATMGL